MSHAFHKRASFGVKHTARTGPRLYDRARWREGRERFLRYNPLCVRCKADDRVVPAQVVDHIEPHRGDEKLFWDETNWQALCKRCHDRKTALETMAATGIPRVPRPACRVVLVAGAPGSGKSHYIDTHKSKGDLVLDLDQLAVEETGKPLHSPITPDEVKLALMRRNRILFDLHDYNKELTVWFPTQAPRWSDRRLWQEVLGCELVVVERDATACARACEGRPPGTDWLALAQKWWSCYSQGPDETIVRVD